MDWIECKKNKLTKEVKVDKNLIESLIKSSSKKIKTQFMIQLDNETATSKISLAYEALRELLEAVAITNGYKIYNHECYCSFLKEVLKESVIADKFNNLRKIRNDINYYGTDVTAEEAKVILEELGDLIKKIKTKLNNKSKG